MDWFSTILGAIIGFISSIGIIVVQRLLDRVGKLEIYVRVVNDRPTGTYTWGFHENADGIILNVPIWIEFQNLSNCNRIIRDINLLLVVEGREVTKMVQSNRSSGRDPYVYANNGSYSLSISGREVKDIECHFLLKASLDVPCFDEIYLRYFDEKNCAHKFSLGKVDGNWSVKEFPRPEEWMRLKEKK